MLQPLMADMLEAIQSSKYSYILNLGHSDTLAVRLKKHDFQSSSSDEVIRVKLKDV